MPDDDWALAQGTVDFRNEERRAAKGRSNRDPFVNYDALTGATDQELLDIINDGGPAALIIAAQEELDERP